MVSSPLCVKPGIRRCAGVGRVLSRPVSHDCCSHYKPSAHVHVVRVRKNISALYLVKRHVRVCETGWRSTVRSVADPWHNRPPPPLLTLLRWRRTAQGLVCYHIFGGVGINTSNVIVCSASFSVQVCTYVCQDLVPSAHDGKTSTALPVALLLETYLLRRCLRMSICYRGGDEEGGSPPLWPLLIILASFCA